MRTDEARSGQGKAGQSKARQTTDAKFLEDEKEIRRLTTAPSELNRLR